MSVYLCIGDSITHGAGYPSDSWVSLLRAEKENNPEENNQVYNLGVSSDTSSGVFNRMDVEIIARKKEDRPLKILIAIGINDSRFYAKGGRQETPINEFEENINNILENAKKYTSDIVVLGLTYVDESKMSPSPWHGLSWSNNEIGKYDEVIKLMADEKNIRFISMKGVIIDSDLKDGLHPNKNGYKKMYERIIKVINE